MIEHGLPADDKDLESEQRGKDQPRHQGAGEEPFVAACRSMTQPRGFAELKGEAEFFSEHRTV